MLVLIRCVILANTDSHDTETADDAQDDAVIEEGDEHRIQISGAPMASMMCVEIICVAPAEGEKIMTDSNFEMMPYGVGTYSNEQPRKLTYRKYWLLDVDGRFSRDLDYLFVAQYVSDDGNRSPLDSSLLHRLEIRQC